MLARKTPIALLAALAAVVPACEGARQSPASPGTDADSDADTDADTDADSDADGDTDPGCEDGAAACSDEHTALACEDGEWVVADECDPESQMCQDGACVDCVSIEFSIQTQQACAISVLDGFELDGEGFIELYGEQYRVFAMDRWGEGHVIAWADATTAAELLGAFNAAGYLGQTEDPEVVSFGDDFLCNPSTGYMPDWVTYLGQDLPAEFQGGGADLAANFDAIIFCGFRIPWGYGWVEEIREFVEDHGRGFMAVMDYEGVVQQQDFENMSAITSQAGIVFDPLNLDWAPTSVSVQLECVPDVPPVVE